MTYDVYAMFPEGSYLVTSSNDLDFAQEIADKVCKELGQMPHATATLTRGEHTLKGNLFTLADLTRR